MIILDNGLLFGATLYITRQRTWFESFIYFRSCSCIASYRRVCMHL